MSVRNFSSIVGLSFGNLVVGLSILLPTAMLTELSSGLDVSIGQAGLLISLGAAVVCISPPLVASFISRIERRALLSAILLLLAFGHVASAWVPHFTGLLAIRLLMLAFAGAFTPLAAETAALVVGEQQRSSAVALALLGWALAMAAGLPIVAVVSPLIGWRAVYELVGVLAGAGFFVLVLGLRPGIVGAPVVFATWSAVSRSGALLLLLLITGLLGAGQLVVVAFVGPLLTQFVAATPQQIALVFGLFGVMNVVGNVFSARLVESWGAFRTSVAFVLCVLAGLAAWTLGSGIFWVMAGGAAIWGFGSAAAAAMQQVRLIATAPRLATASVSLNNTVLYLGQAIGAGLGGVLFTKGQFGATGFTALAFIGLAFVLIWFTRTAPSLAAPSLGAPGLAGVRFDAETIQLLARAFDSAWDRYVENATMDEDVASRHAELATYIVAMAKAGERDEERLSMKGYMRLRAMQSVVIRSGLADTAETAWHD
jgi:DHA1 family inner membrane transport protein